jgi:hypothetical protein
VNGEDSVEVMNVNAFDVKDSVNDVTIPERKVKKNVPINSSAEVQNLNTFDINDSVRDTVITKMKVRKKDNVKTNFTIPTQEVKMGIVQY